MKIKRTPADKWFSDCVRIRSNWVCEYCLIDFNHNRGELDCSHFISRKYQSTRVHPLVAVANCTRCHEKLGGGRWGGGNIAEFAAHYDDIHGYENREFIRRLSKVSFIGYKHHLKPMSDHYRKCFREMEKRRGSGDDERIDFPFYNGCKELNAIIKEIKC